MSQWDELTALVAVFTKRKNKMSAINLEMPSWLKRGMGNMDEERFDPPPVATIPMPEKQNVEAVAEEMPRNGGAHNLTLYEATVMAEQYKQDKEKWAKLAEDAGQRIKDLDRANKFMELELLQARNDLQTVQSTVYDLQQQNADLRALQSELHALARHIITRYEHHEIPLPVRKRTKNSDKTKPMIPPLAEQQPL